MMSLAQKVLAMTVLVFLNVVVLVIGVGFAGVFGLFVAVVFFVMSGAAAWRLVTL